MECKDLKIIVTGGAAGMGRYFVEQLHAAGAQVAAGDVNTDALATLPEGVFTRGLDVSDSADCAAFVAEAAEALGGLNGLINNAGIIRDGRLVKKDRSTGQVVTMSDEQWASVIAVNLSGVTFMTRELVAWMVEHDVVGGVVVNMSSIARHGNFGQTNYVATKAAVAANTVTWAREFAKQRVRVGAIAPGMIETPMTRGMNQRARDALVARVPVGRIGDPDDIWRAVRFVIECDYFNGKTIDVDGGLVM